MQETADSCPVCGRWRQQVQIAGGGATVREPLSEDKTKIFDKNASASLASEKRIRQAEEAERERQSRRAAAERTSRYLQEDPSYAQQVSSYDPKWNDESYWQSYNDHYDPLGAVKDYERETQASYSRRSAARSGQRNYREDGADYPRTSRQPQGRPQQGSRSQGARPQAGRAQTRSGGYQTGSRAGGTQNRQRQQSDGSRRPSGGERSRSAMRQLRSDVGPAVREVRTRVQSGVTTALRDPKSRQRRILAVAGIATAAVILLIVVINAFSSGGEKTVLKKLAKAYENQKSEEVAELSSDLMKALYPGDQLDAECRNCVGTVKDYFTERLDSSSYSMSYKTEITENYTGAALSQQMESTFGVFGESYDMSRVKEMTKATLTLKARHDHTAEKRIQVTLVKEDGKWRLASQNY